MSCPSCGDKPENVKKVFPSTVVEINNPEEIVLFRKVVIPASMGDEEDVPAAIGKYRNVLLNYEKNNHSYLYSSDGIPTLLTSEVAEAIEERVENLEATLADEITVREKADNDLQTEIDTKANTTDLSPVALSGDYDDLTDKPTIGTGTLTVQRNATNVGTFSANATSDATINITVPTTPADIGAQPIIGSSDKLSADLVDDTNSTNKFVTAAQSSAINTALQPASINKDVISDLTVDNTISTSTVKLNSTKENILTGNSTTTALTLPVASSVTAGVMNSATYDAVTSNTNNINALLNGAVAVTGLSASPSQSDITTAWQTETGLTTLINRAAVYDVTNDKVWTYYTNDTTWHAASNTTQVTVSTFTNSSEGVIKGSTNAGQVYAENDGTGSVNGWDTLNNTVSGKQDALTAGSNITITGTTIAASNNKAGQSSSTTNGDFPVLLKNTANTTNETAATKYNGSFTFNPSTGKVKATSGAITSGDANLVTGDAVNSALSNYATTASLATVATSGSYNDLLNKPTIPAAQVNSDWDAASGVAQILNKPSLATVATSGSYNDLTNKPTIPAAQVQSNWTQTNTSSADYIKNKPNLATVATSGSYTDLSNKPSLATVATSGSYNDLTNKPTIPAAQIQSDWTQTNTVSKDYIKNKPTIPTVNDSTITVTNNGTSKGTFTTNQASAGTVALDYPVITMQSTDPGEGTALAANNFVAVYGGDPIILDYSTSEVNTGAKWIDGTAIYKKTINFGALPNATTKNVAHNISNLNRIVKMEGYAYASSTSTFLPLPFVSTTAANCVYLDATTTDVIIGTGINRSNIGESYVTIYYTKTS